MHESLTVQKVSSVDNTINLDKLCDMIFSYPLLRSLFYIAKQTFIESIHYLHLIVHSLTSTSDNGLTVSKPGKGGVFEIQNIE